MVIEHSANNYSPTVLEYFRRDWFVWFTLGYGLFTMAFMGLTIIYGWEVLLLCSVLFLWNLILLGIYLRYILEKINPISIIREISETTIKEIEKIPKKIKVIGNEEIKKDKTGKLLYVKQNVPEIFNESTLQSNSKILQNVIKLETTLQNITLMSLKKDEYQSTKAVLDSYPRIASSYIKIIPDAHWINDKFLEGINERLVAFSNKALIQKDPIFLKQVIDTAKSVGMSLNEIQTSGYGTDYVRSLANLVFQFSGIAKKCLTLEMYDGVLDIVRAFGNIGTESVKKHGNDSLTTKEILEIGKLAVFIKESLICATCIEQDFAIIQAMITTTNEMMLRTEFKDLSEFFVNVIKSRLATPFCYKFVMDSPGLNAIGCVDLALSIKNGEYPPIETHGREEFEKNTISFIMDFVGSAGIASKDHDVLISTYSSECLAIIIARIVQEKFKTIPDRHTDEIHKAISYLTSMHHYDNNRHTDYGQTIATRLAESSVLCSEGGYGDLAKQCIDRIDNLARRIIPQDHLGYETNRTHKQLNIIGCYAIMSSNNDILEYVSKKIVEFDKDYEKTYGKIPDDELDLERPSYAVDMFESRSKILVMKNIMHQDNKSKFVQFIIQQKIDSLKRDLASQKSTRK